MNFRKGNQDDVQDLKELAVQAWSQYKEQLTPENWKRLSQSLSNPATYSELLNKSECFLCEDDEGGIIGMAFMVPSGNPTEDYKSEWCHLRFMTVRPDYRGKGIGKRLAEKCIELAMANQETVMALHTSEMMDAARNMYEKIGFKQLKEMKPRLGKQYWMFTLNLTQKT